MVCADPIPRVRVFQANELCLKRRNSTGNIEILSNVASFAPAASAPPFLERFAIRVDPRLVSKPN
jgi:hypothetical protein